MVLYLTADDFGRDEFINDAVRQAHVRGTLNSASLMVTGSAWREAAAMARELPGLDVGLHLVLSDGKSVLPPARIPHLVNERGEFRNSPGAAGWHYWWNRAAQQELPREIEAQFARFNETGLLMSHIDGHQHLHLHPVVLNSVLPLAERHGARRIRIPHDSLRLALRSDRSQAVAKVAATCTFRLLEENARRRLRGSNLCAAAHTYGFMRSGNMEERYVISILEQLPPGPAEIYFHPTTARSVEPLGPNRGDFETLMSPRVRELVAARGAAAAVIPPGVATC